MNKLTFEQVYNQPDFKAFREMCKAENLKMSDPKALKLFIEENSHLDYTLDQTQPLVYEFNPHYKSWNGDYMSEEDGDKFLVVANTDDPFGYDYLLHDIDTTRWTYVDTIGNYIMSCIKLNRGKL